MTDLYRQLAVPVDPEFNHALKARLDSLRVRPEARAGHPSTDVTSIQPALTEEVTLVLKPVKRPDHRRGRMALIAAAVVAVVGTGILLLAGEGDGGPNPAVTIPPTSQPAVTLAPSVVAPTTAPPTSEAPPSIPATMATVSASADRQFAAAVALSPDDWGPNYSVDPVTVRWRMARELAETLPACTPFLDTVFEGPSRPATVTTAMATTFINAHWQYVVVFPDVAGAEAMMTAIHDPRYAECDRRYRNQYWYWMGAPQSDDFGIGEPPDLDLAGDDSAIMDITASFFEGGHVSIPFVREGRTVMMFDAETYDSEQLVAIVARAVERVDAAEAGTPLPATAVPTSYLAKTIMPTDNEFGENWTALPNVIWKLHNTSASLVPTCSAYVDTFVGRSTPSLGFESDTFVTDPLEVTEGGGVIRVMTIAYPNEQAAVDAIDAMSDPGFPRCLADYTSAEPGNSSWHSTTREPIAASQIAPLGEESVSMEFTGSYTGLTGSTSQARPIVDVFIRVGQVLIGVEATLDHISTGELEPLLQQFVERAEAAIVGAPIPPR